MFGEYLVDGWCALEGCLCGWVVGVWCGFTPNTYCAYVCWWVHGGECGGWVVGVWCGFPPNTNCAPTSNPPSMACWWVHGGVLGGWVVGVWFISHQIQTVHPHAHHRASWWGLSWWRRVGAQLVFGGNHTNQHQQPTNTTPTKHPPKPTTS